MVQKSFIHINMIKSWFTLLFIFVACSATSSETSTCKLADCETKMESESGWTLGVGVAAVAQIPHYMGSDENRSLALPIPYIRYDGPRLKIGQRGIVAELFDSEKWFLSLSMSGAIPVDSEDNAARRGMPDLEAVFEYGPSLKYYIQGNNEAENAVFIDMNIREARTISLDSLGLNASPSIVVRRELGKKVFEGTLNWRLRYSREFVSDRYAGYFYDVDPIYANENRPQFDAKGGKAGYRISSGVRWQKGKNVVSLFAMYADLHRADYVESPLVKTKHHLFGGISYFWLF